VDPFSNLDTVYNYPVEDGVNFCIYFSEQNSDDAFAYSEVVYNDYDDSAICLRSTKPVNSMFFNVLLDLLDVQEFPWRSLWELSENYMERVELHYIHIPQKEGEEYENLSKISVLSEGGESFHKEIRDLLSTLKSYDLSVSLDEEVRNA